jgi:hypothetical protein
MNQVKVRRADLLAKVRANRDAHRDLFLKAMTASMPLEALHY